MRTKSNRMDLIKNLNLWGNDLEDISVLQYMPNLEVLSLSVNSVSSLADLKYCLKLSELYLRKNEIRDLGEVLNLRHLQQMRVLWLSDNPCATLPHYRQYVLHHLPNLTKLDSLDVTHEERRQAAEADLDGMQTRVTFTPHDDAQNPEMPEFSELAARRSQALPVELPLDAVHHSNSGISEEEYFISEQRLVDEDRPQRVGGGAQVRGRKSPTGVLDAEEHPSPVDRFHGGASGRSTEFNRAEFFRDSPAMRNSQARPAPTSPTAGTPQWQQRQRQNGIASSPVSSGVAAERELGVRGGEQAWSHEQSHERAYARGDPRTGAASRSSGASAQGLTPSAGYERSLSSQSWSPEDGGASPAQPSSATDNILCAVLALIKELDSQGLELVRRAVEQRKHDGP